MNFVAQVCEMFCRVLYLYKTIMTAYSGLLIKQLLEKVCLCTKECLLLGTRNPTFDRQLDLQVVQDTTREPTAGEKASLATFSIQTTFAKTVRVRLCAPSQRTIILCCVHS